MPVEPERHPWSQACYRQILEAFAASGYQAMTFTEYWRMPAGERNRLLLLRCDVDERLDRVPVLLEPQNGLGLRATWFIHVHASYNAFSYDGYDIVKRIVASGGEVALHSNFVEFATLMGEEPGDVLRRERAILEAICGRPVLGHACHRDMNYVYNSLPWLEACGGVQECGFLWEAYDPLFTTENILYVNEALVPRHLGWSVDPEGAAQTGQNVCLFVHPHWWHRKYPTGA
jgi:hypothetical protein